MRRRGERSRDAQSLLLAAGDAGRAGLEAILYLVPQRRLAQRALDDLVHLAPLEPHGTKAELTFYGTNPNH